MHRNLMAVSLPVIGIVAGAPPALAARSAPARPDTAEAKVTWSPLQDHSGKAVDDRHASGALRIAADISAPGGLEGWTLAVDPASRAAHPGFGPLCQEHFTEPVTRAEVRCDWDTEHRSGGEPSANQGYVVRITGDGGGSSLRDGTRAVTVSNPASAPGSLRVDQADGRIRLTWAAAREPDAAGYTVARQKGDEPWRPVAAPETPAWEGDLDQPGRYRFRIGTRRPGDSSATPRQWTTSDELVVPDPDGSQPRRDRGDRADGAERPRSSSGDQGTDPPPPDSPGASPPSPEAAPSAPEAAPAPDASPAPPTAPSAEDDPAPRSAPARQGAPAQPEAAARPAAPSPPPRSATPTVWTVALPASPADQPRVAGIRAPSARPRRPAVAAGAETGRSGPPVAPPAAGPDEAPGAGDAGFSLDLPYGPPATTAGPPAREEALTARHEGGDDRRRPLTALAFGQVCFILSLQGRYLLHRAGAHRFGRGAHRTVRRCPSCRARFSEVPQPS